MTGSWLSEQWGEGDLWLSGQYGSGQACIPALALPTKGLNLTKSRCSHLHHEDDFCSIYASELIVRLEEDTVYLLYTGKESQSLRRLVGTRLELESQERHSSSSANWYFGTGWGELFQHSKARLSWGHGSVVEHWPRVSR